MASTPIVGRTFELCRPQTGGVTTVATLQVPHQLAERLLADPSLPISLTICVGQANCGTLQVGDEEVSFQSAYERHRELFQQDEPNDAFRLIGAVHERLSVGQNSNTAAAAQAQLERSSTTAREASDERKAIPLADNHIAARCVPGAKGLSKTPGTASGAHVRHRPSSSAPAPIIPRAARARPKEEEAAARRGAKAAPPRDPCGSHGGAQSGQVSLKRRGADRDDTNTEGRRSAIGAADGGERGKIGKRPSAPVESSACSTTPPAASGSASAGAAARRQLSVPADLRISSSEQLDECKREFRARYKLYLTIDEELAANTAKFEQLEAQHARASSAEARALAEHIQQLWAQGQPSTLRKVEEYRRLHVELSRLKQAINQWVATCMDAVKAESLGRSYQ